VLTLVHLDAQPEPDPISDVEPVRSRNWIGPRSYLPRFDMTHAGVLLRMRCSLSVVFFGAPASRPTQ